jgi:hypothetical protein
MKELFYYLYPNVEQKLVSHELELWLGAYAFELELRAYSNKIPEFEF